MGCSLRHLKIIVFGIVSLILAGCGTMLQDGERGSDAVPTENTLVIAPETSNTLTPIETDAPTETAVMPIATIVQPTTTALPEMDVEATGVVAETATPTPKATPTVSPTEEVTPEATPTVAAPNDNYLSGALGLSRAQWEQGRTHTGTWLGVFEEYEGGALNYGYNIGFYGDRVAHIEKTFPPPYLTASEADTIGATLIPDDAELKEVYSPPGRPETTVRLYYSPSLAPRYEADLFCDSEPGYFIVQYTSFEGEIEYILISIGDCP